MRPPNPEVCLPRRPETTGVALLRGDPKTAIVRLSAPMIAAMLLMSTYNIVNAIWVAGLGSDAMAAIGILVLSFLIFFHELGHFLAARYFGVRVEVFSIGFGKKFF